MKEPEISVVVKEPFALAGEHQKKGAKVPVSPADARMLVGSGKATYATEEDRKKAHHRGEIGQPGLRTRVGPGGPEVEEVEELNPRQEVNILDKKPAGEFAQERRKENPTEDQRKPHGRKDGERVPSNSAKKGGEK